MRYLCLVAVLLALPFTATAQEQRRDERRSGDRGADQRDRQRRDEDRKPTSPTQPWWEQKQVPWWEQQPRPAWEKATHPNTLNDRDARRDAERSHRRNYRPSVIYVLPPYRYFPNAMPTTQLVVTPPNPAPAVAPITQPHLPPMGALRLEVEPRDLLQVFVDGNFVGTPADLGEEIELTPGTRRIELRARDHKTLTFSAEIVDGRSITYRGSLDRVEPIPPPAPPPIVAAAPPRKPTPMYMIQGCYLGNVEPKVSDLKPGCDIKRMVTILP